MSALMLELAKCLKLVAPISMSADAQMVWLQAAADALEGIQAREVAAVSAEVRRSVTRPSQIVPTIAELVSKRRNNPKASAGPWSAMDYVRKAIENGDLVKAQLWFDEAKKRGEIGYDAEFIVPAPPPRPEGPPLNAAEIRAMPKWIRDMGLRVGFLKREGGQIVDIGTPKETNHA